MKGMAASSALSCGSHNIKAIKKAAYAASYHFLSIVTPVSNASCDTDAPGWNRYFLYRDTHERITFHSGNFGRQCKTTLIPRNNFNPICALYITG